MDTCYINTSVLRFDPYLNDPAYGGDAVILDLEDGVHRKSKEDARSALAALNLSHRNGRRVKFGVRINAVDSIDGIRDIELLHRIFHRDNSELTFIQIPKIRSADDVTRCRAWLGESAQGLRLVPIIETPEGIEQVERIASVSDAMMFGRVDMAASMYKTNEAYMAYARGRFCVACASHGIEAIDTASVGAGIGINDTAAFEQECIDGRSEGFTAKAVIHPLQVGIVKRVFEISSDEIAKFHATIQRYERAESGFALDGTNVIAPPFVTRARMMLRLYNQT